MKNVKSDGVSLKLGEILYLCFFGSLLFAKGIGLYDGQLLFKLILIFATGCLLVKFAIEEYNWVEIGKIVGVLVISGGTYFISGEKGFLLYGLMMVGLKNVSLNRVFKVGAALWTVAFFGITVTSLFHMQDTMYRVDAKLGLGHIFRWSLGYPHPNVLHVSYLILGIFFVYLLGEKFKFKHALWIFLGNCLVFLYSVSYTGFIMVMVLLVGRIYLMLRKKLNLVEKFLIQLIVPVCVFLSLVAPVTLKGRAFAIVNQLLSTRLELAWRYLQPEYASLFGVRLADITTESLTMDNSYLFAYITYGKIPFCLIVAATLALLFVLLKKKKNIEALIVVTIAIGGLTEPFLYNTSFKNLGFLFMGMLLFSPSEAGKEKKSIAVFPRWNREWKLPIFTKRIILFSHKCTGYFVGVACAIIACVITCLTLRLPAGYVVSRSSCSDLTKELHYYSVDNEEFENYHEMESFEEGAQVEYFTGNIVKLEKTRSIISSLVLGYSVGYGFVMIFHCTRKKNGEETA